MNSEAPSLESLVAQACHYIDESTGGIIPPIQPSTTFARDSGYEYIGDYSYSRSGNPGYIPVEKLAAMLDGGEAALSFASGMAAITAVFETLEQGDHVVAPEIMYHGTLDWLRRISQKRGIEVTFFDATEPGALERAVRKTRTAIVWIESPVNPTWDIMDIAEAARIAHVAGALLAVDGTVATPVTQRPLQLGADIVFHSATKYLNGHSDVIAGILVTKKVDERWQEIELVRTLMGGVMGPFESWLLLRGMRTLFLRYERSCASAMKIAQALESHPKLEAVLYPGLESHPGHDIARRQMVRGYGAMLSLLVRGGEQAARRLAASCRLFVPATSLGGVESLVEHRASVEGPHSLVPRNLVRLSVGIENEDDLVADLEQALGTL